MDCMEDYEIQTLSGMIDYADYTSWQQTRLMFYAMLKPYMKNKNMTPQELLPLATDNTYNNEEHVVEITNNQRDSLRNRAVSIGNKMFANNKNKQDTLNG